MALLLDTQDVEVGNREASIHETFARAEVPRNISLTAPAAADRTRIEAWMFGTMMLFSPDSPGLRVVRTPVLDPMDPIVVLLIQLQGSATFIEDGQHRRSLRPGGLMMARPTSPNEFIMSGISSAFQLPFDEVGLTVETISKASECVPSSPLYPLVSHYLMSIRADADHLDSSPTISLSVASATTQLVRALLVSAAQDGRNARLALAEAIVPRIFAYVRQHLTEPDLSPASIANAHNISVSYLYKLCETAQLRLMDWVIQQRLEGARHELMNDELPHGSIAHIAHIWGFKSASHFSTRFRQAYGVSPRELLRLSRRAYRDHE